MNLNEFTNDRLPFQYGEILPEDCTKHEIPMGAVPDEKDDTMPCSYMDEIFAAGNEQPVPPVPPVPPVSEPTIFYYSDGTTSETEDTKLTQSSYDRTKTLVNVEIGDSVTSIGDWAFQHCSGLTSVTIPNSVTSIGYDAFYGCTGLTSITVPNNVTHISGGAFYFSYNPYTVILESEECKIDLVDGEGKVIYAFSEDTESSEIRATIIIPKGSSSSYRNHDAGWELYDSYIHEAE